jgi:hypothetical protein
MFVKLLGKRRRFLAAGLSVTAIGLYTILVGAEAAVVRAALMAPWRCSPARSAASGMGSTAWGWLPP